MSLNLNFLTEESKKEFIELYGEDCSDYDISSYAYNKAKTNFNKYDDIIFDIIDEVFMCKWHNFNLDFDCMSATERNGIRRYYIFFNFEDIDFAYSPDGESTTTDYGIEVMNEHFKYKDECKIKNGGCGTLEVIVQIKDNDFYKGD